MAEFNITEELTQYLDLADGIDSREKLIEAIDGKYISRDEAAKDPKIIGAINGGYETQMKNFAKDQGIEFDEGELTGKKLPEIMQVALTKQKTGYSAQIDELKQNKPDTEAVKKWEEKYNKQGASLNEYKSLSTQRAGEIEKMKADQETFIKTQKIKVHKEGAFNSVEYSNQADKLRLKGFRMEMDETYKPETDEDGNIFPTKDGKRIANEKKKDTFLTYQELINFEADKAGLTAKNKQVTRQAVTGQRQTGSGIVGKPGETRRKVAPR